LDGKYGYEAPFFVAPLTFSNPTSNKSTIQ